MVVDATLLFALRRRGEAMEIVKLSGVFWQADETVAAIQSDR